MSDLVVVTDAAGFLGQWCVISAIRHGLRVRAVSTSFEDMMKVARAATAHVDVTGLLETIILDPYSAMGWPIELADARYVIHTTRLVDTPERTAGINQEFTTRLLQVAKKAGVERVVMPSSLSAALPSGDEIEADENTWTDPTLPGEGGILSAIERSAVECADELGLELVTVLPGMLLGSPADAGLAPGATPTTKLELISDLVLGRVQHVQKHAITVTDVRDAADACVVALVNPSAAGRYCLPGGTYWLTELARVIKHRLGFKARMVPRLELSGWKHSLLSWLTITTSRHNVGTPNKVMHSARRAEQDLDWAPRDTDDTLVASAEFILKYQSFR